jgi:hypothetical protein
MLDVQMPSRCLLQRTLFLLQTIPAPCSVHTTTPNASDHVKRRLVDMPRHMPLKACADIVTHVSYKQQSKADSLGGELTRPPKALHGAFP